MGVFGVLMVLVAAGFGIAWGSDCVRETEKCNEYWVRIEPHKGLFETEKELNRWCRKQIRFYRCLEDVLLNGTDDGQITLPKNLLISLFHAEDLCTDGSPNRKKYLSNAACINRLNTEYCTIPEYLDIIEPDENIPPSRCSLANKTYHCISATILSNCGFGAVKIYETMVKITRYSKEVCDVEASRGLPCDESESENPKRAEELGRIYYGLVDRIGSIPEQSELTEFPFLDDIGSGNIDEAVTEAIQSALDSLDRDTISESYLHESDIPSVLPDSPQKEDQSHVAYKRNPIITEFYKDLLFYNYSGIEYALYWRQPNFNIAENITCQHLFPTSCKYKLMRCKMEFRSEDPDCVTDATVHEQVTPELIRDLDPEVPHDSNTELGPRQPWMEELLGEKLEDLKSDADGNLVLRIPTAYTTTSTLLHLASIFSRPRGVGIHNWWQYLGKWNFLLQTDILEELLELFLPEPENAKSPFMSTYRIENARFALIDDPVITDLLENVTCSRVNECNQRGKGLFRCKAWHLQPSYEGCYGEAEDSIVELETAPLSSKEDLEPSRLEHTGIEVTEVASRHSSEEPIALVFEDVKLRKMADADHVVSRREYGAADESYMNDFAAEEEYEEEDYDDDFEAAVDVELEDSSPDVQLVLLDLETKDLEKSVYVSDPDSEQYRDYDSEVRESVQPSSEYELLNDEAVLLEGVPIEEEDDDKERYVVVAQASDSDD